MKENLESISDRVNSIINRYNEPERTKELEKLTVIISKNFTKTNPKEISKSVIIKTNLDKLLKRYKQSRIKGLEFTSLEIEHYQTKFILDFYLILHSDDFIIHIQDKIRELNFFIESLDYDLKNDKELESSEKENKKFQLFESRKYLKYLTVLLNKYENIYHGIDLENLTEEENKILSLIFEELESSIYTNIQHLEQIFDITKNDNSTILKELNSIEKDFMNCSTVVSCYLANLIDNVANNEENLFNELTYDFMFEFYAKEMIAYISRQKQELDYTYYFKYFLKEYNYDIALLDEYITIIAKGIHYSKLKESYQEILKETEISIPEIPVKQIKISSIKLTSFTYKKRDKSVLTDIFKALKSNKLVNESTQLQDFRKVFSGGEITNPVIWTGNISELYYFIKELHNTHKKVEDTRQQIWKITANCFLDADGKKYDSTKFRVQKAPAATTVIDDIIKILK